MQLTCFVCSKPADTQEHLFPKWLQHRFNLWDQRLTLPNRTTIPYRRLTIPACRRCNNDVLAPLEMRIERDTATESDVWKWANKVHYALGQKDQFLEWDRRHPGYKIGDVLDQSDPLERDRHFLHTIAGHFRTDPDPFGSVFRFEFASPQPFAFAHIVLSRSICISIGKIGYIVYVLDGQALKRDGGMGDFHAAHAKRCLPDMLFFYANTVEHMARHRLGQTLMWTAGTPTGSPGFLARVGKTVVHDVTPFDEARFRLICRALGIEWVDAGPWRG